MDGHTDGAIIYTIEESARRRRTIGISVLPGGAVVVRVPRGYGARARSAVAEKRAWILRAQERVRHHRGVPSVSAKEREQVRERARTLVHERLAHFNRHYQLPIKRVAIKYTRRLWGSCSSAGNLNFNAALVHLPPTLQDYLVVHELCHIREHNHSPRFWALVGEVLPEYAALRRELRNYRLSARGK